MKNLQKTFTISAIAALVAVAGISVAQTTAVPNSTSPNTPTTTTTDTTVNSTPAPAKPGGLKSLPTMTQRLDGSGSQGSRHEYNNPAVAPAAPTVTDSSALPADTTSTTPAVTPAPAIDSPARAPRADRN